MKTNVTLSTELVEVSKCLLIALIILFSGCSSRKVETEKKVEKLNELVQTEISFENDITTKTNILKITKDRDFSISPLDPEKPSRLSYKGDTLDLFNAEVRFNNSEKTEKTEELKEDLSKTTDHSSLKTDRTSKEKNRESERESASWGLNIGIALGIIVLIITVYLHFRSKALTK